MSNAAPPPPPPPPPGPPGGGSPYGGAPPPPPGGYYGPGAGEGPYSPTEAFSYGWAKFRSRPGQVLVPILVVLVVVIVVQVILQVLLRSTILGTHDCTSSAFGQTVQTKCGPGFVTTLFGSALAGLVSSLISQALGAGLIKNALNVVDGGEASVGEVFAWAGKGPVIVTALLVAVITAVGTLLCYVPGIIAGFLLNWALFFVVDKGLEPVEAIKASVSFAVNNLGNTILFYLLGIVAFVVGACLCLVGLLVTVPVVLLGAAYTFRKLQGESVTAAA